MCVPCLGLVVLVGVLGALHAEGAARPCLAPRLKGGYFVPQAETYTNSTQLVYGCDSGLKPAAEGWWAPITCQDGEWSPEPQCIDSDACTPLTVPNGKYDANEKGWYEAGYVMRITCDEGYRHKNWDATAHCINGTWSSVPICEESNKACHEPPDVPHAVVISTGHHQLFAEETELLYQCEEGYTVEGADSDRKSIYCITGGWTPGPNCIKKRRPGTGHGGSGGGGQTPPAGSGTRPTVRTCGAPPVVPHGEAVGRRGQTVKYQCGSFYKLVGPEWVVCHDGTWSQAPTCQATFCAVNTDDYSALKPAGVKYLKDGESLKLDCVRQEHWWTDHFSVLSCSEGRATLTRYEEEEEEEDEEDEEEEDVRKPEVTNSRPRTERMISVD
ncbi:uncharacterized protein V6R79_016306 [Siganus canaliculatus]